MATKRKVGRPNKPEKEKLKNEVIIAFKKNDYHYFKNLAKNENKTPSTLIREIILNQLSIN